MFCRTKRGADRVARQLGSRGVAAVAIHGDRSQNQRDRALEDFRGGRAQAIVATDVAARGIHVDGVAAVVHFDPTEDQKDYVHRSGRTGRAGAAGAVISLVPDEHRRDLVRQQRSLGRDIRVITPAPASLPEAPPWVAPAPRVRVGPTRRQRRRAQRRQVEPESQPQQEHLVEAEPARRVRRAEPRRVRSILGRRIELAAAPVLAAGTAEPDS